MVHSMNLLSVRALQEEDAPVVQSWLRTYLAEHLAGSPRTGPPRNPT